MIGLPIQILGRQQPIIRRIYFRNEIKNITNVKVFFNETPVDILCQSSNFDKDEEKYRDTKTSSPSDIYFSLSTKISILIKMKDLRLILKKYNEKYFEMDSISSKFEDKIMSFSDGTSVICLRNEIHSKNTQDLTDDFDKRGFVIGEEDLVGYGIHFYRPHLKLQIVDKKNTVLNSNEIMLQAFNNIDEEGQLYCLFGTHFFNRNLVMKARLSEFELITELIIRVMDIFDVPLNTRCDEATSYSIMINNGNNNLNTILFQ
jgi:hypothetical protein